MASTPGRPQRWFPGVADGGCLPSTEKPGRRAGPPVVRKPGRRAEAAGGEEAKPARGACRRRGSQAARGSRAARGAAGGEETGAARGARWIGVGDEDGLLGSGACVQFFFFEGWAACSGRKCLGWVGSG